MATEPGAPAATAGLTSAQVAERVATGLVNRTAVRPSRTVAQIVRANVLTPFNAVLGVLLAVILVVGPLQDALFGFILVANSAVGIVQELRAKRTLDRLSVLSAPTATALRDGARVSLPAEQVVRDDVLVLERGDQLVVDGVVLSADGLEVDESLLTGESDPVPKVAGDEVLSGSFVVAGAGRARADRVGAAAYAVTLAAEARRFTLVHSELRESLNRLLRVLGWILIPTAALLITTQLLNGRHSVEEAVRGSVAALVGMVPEGLVLLTSIALAVGIVRLGGRGVLVQEMPAIEGLARVDILGIDKTGTLTEGTMTVAELVPLHGSADGGGPDVAQVLGAVAHADEQPNVSLRAIADAYPAPDGWVVAGGVPFSSDRTWSAVTFAGHGSWVLGAPEVLLPAGEALVLAEDRASTGLRVLLIARAAGPPSADARPTGLEPFALVVLAERLRADAADTLRYFAGQGVTVKVISGDNPRTVGAVAAALGLPGADRPVDARDLPQDDDALGLAVEASSVFGRVTPQQKRSMVGALQRRGHVVAMTGDGVNDVLALKDADIGIAMGSGAAASRAVAQLVLLDSRFDVMPDVVAEGRRVIANIERVANLFLTKTVYVALLAVVVSVTLLPFPFYPRHLTIIASLTIGIPAFFLALAPNAQRARPHLLRRVLRFAVPAGVVAAAATFTTFALTYLRTDLGLLAARTTATVVLFGVGMSVLTLLARPLNRLKVLLLASLVGAFAVLMLTPFARDF
ncbi:MAG TPA: HAD-IC family P-type ATPase, partial [Actinotalea sp.]|nr:HAD-IC family P-type ATPase [Actinotalea sp.]